MLALVAPLIVLTAVDAPAPAVPAEAARGWSKAPFSIPPRELLTLAARARRDMAKRTGDSRSDVIVWKSTEHEISGDRVTVRSHNVYAPMTEDGARWLAVVKTSKPGPGVPRVRARVITPDGNARMWDGDSISKLHQVDPAWPDTARLPGVAPGCVLEQVTVTDSKPLLPGGASDYDWFQGDVWAARVQVVAPATDPLRGLSSGVVGVQQQRRDRGKLTEIEWTVGPQRFSDSSKPGGPEMPRPFIAWTTWKSWPQISARLAEAIEPRIKPRDAAEVAERVAGGATSPEEIAARLMSHIQRTFELEKGAVADEGLIPKATADIVKARSANARDQAALLVAALRARGLQADFSLVQWLFHMSDELPTLDNFDTPLVMITGPGLKAPLWIDLMYGQRPDDVTIELGGKRALPIRVKGADLVALPRSTRTRPPH